MSKLSKEVIFVAMVMATYLNGHALAQMRPCELMDYLLNSTVQGYDQTAFLKLKLKTFTCHSFKLHFLNTHII